VLLLFQPGEETGSGAEMVLEDNAFKEFNPGMVLALHNLPGFTMGSVITAPGPFAEASSGLVIRLRGKSSHAAEPLLGISPGPAVASLISDFEELCIHESGILVTLIHAVIGEAAFGTSPGEAVVMATLRAPTEELMEDLSNSVLKLVRDISLENRLEFETEWTEEFPATVNSIEADSLVRSSAGSLGLDVIPLQKPFPWSEDFGHFTGKFGGALFGLGAGIDAPPLHNPAYDFPDQLIETGIILFMKMIERTLGIEE
jgi:metal-dependent amidase/aminoacylase/carboxypeptidase family protein